MTEWGLVLSIFVPGAFFTKGTGQHFLWDSAQKTAGTPRGLLLTVIRTWATFIIKGSMTRFLFWFNKIIENYLMQGVQWPINVWTVASGLRIYKYLIMKGCLAVSQKEQIKKRAELRTPLSMYTAWEQTRVRTRLSQGRSVTIWPVMKYSTWSCFSTMP